MHLATVSSCQTIEAERPTQELSVTERMRGARREDLFMEVWEPLDVVEDRPCIQELAKHCIVVLHTHIHAVALQRLSTGSLRTRGRAHGCRCRTIGPRILVAFCGGGGWCG